MAASASARCASSTSAPRPGGKAFHLAEILHPGSEVVAVEIHPRKADALRREAGLRGLTGIRVVCADGSKPIPGLELASFDAVLVDAPCAGLGTLRRHPELKLRRTAADLPRFADLQEAILRNALLYAKPGAPVTYSVCSLSRAEGPEVVARAGRASPAAPPRPRASPPTPSPPRATCSPSPTSTAETASTPRASWSRMVSP